MDSLYPNRFALTCFHSGPSASPAEAVEGLESEGEGEGEGDGPRRRRRGEASAARGEGARRLGRESAPRPVVAAKRSSGERSAIPIEAAAHARGRAARGMG